MSVITGNIDTVLESMAAAAVRSGRRPADIRLLAVTKGVSSDAVREALSHAGVKGIGENYVPEAYEKLAHLTDISFEKHMIGHLQRNKVRSALELFDWVESIDSLRLAEALHKEACLTEQRIKGLLQVNIGSEGSKGGFEVQEVCRAVELISGMQGIDLRGLMVIPPQAGPEEAREYFVRTRIIRDETESATGLKLPELSMGMSGDYRTAIEEGATIVRIGTAIFGERRRTCQGA